MSVTFSDDELDMLTERMTKPTLIPTTIPSFPTEVVNAETGAVSQPCSTAVINPVLRCSW